jgi:mono/diheme cytochrome c family protein
MSCRWLPVVALGLFFSPLTGCGSNQPAAAGPKGLFDQHCARCHAQAGEPGGPGVGSSKGPNLSHIGSERSATWLADYIRDPKSKRRDARMPGFADTLKEEEIRALAEYLAAMK